MVELTVRRGVLLFIGLWLFALLWGRAWMFAEVWGQESSQAKEFIATDKRCVADHEYQHDAPTTCMRATVEKDRWPLLRAVGIVFERTYLCGAAPCGDVVRSIFDSWSALVVLVAISVTGTCIVCSGMFKRAEQGYYAPQAPRYPENAYGVNGPAIMVGYDGDAHVPLQLPPGQQGGEGPWGRRFAGYVSYLGGARRDPHQKLI